ncbi:DUF5689 domain-containing protein [Pedobacter sp.]
MMMKKTLINICFIATTVAAVVGCKRDTDYVQSTPSPFISNFDLKKSFKETDLSLTGDILKGANSIKGVVVSDFTGGNSPSGLLVVQNSRMVGNGIDSVRGVAINIGADATKYAFGDSVHIKIEGATMKRMDGVLQIIGVPTSSITKVSSGKAVKIPVVNAGQLLASPKTYESTLITISNTVVEPEPGPSETFAGDKVINDGFGRASLHTEATAVFANEKLPPSANFTGVVYFKQQGSVSTPQLWIRKLDDAFELPLIKPSAVIITGYLPDPQGSDANYEYIQLLATKDIDFSQTPYSVVTTNNAGSTNPFPVNGWAIGGARSYKFNLTSGTVSKGQFFYVGGTTKLIWGANSTNISSAKWISSVDYTAVAGADFGAVTTNLLANSGNVAGMAVFSGTTVNASTVPLDVIMYGGSNANSGNVYSAGPPEVGYRITNTDYYTTINPSTRRVQNFFAAGTNTNRLGFQITQANPTGGSFIRLGGIYDATSGRWKTGRALFNVTMKLTSQLADIETGGATTLEN